MTLVTLAGGVLQIVPLGLLRRGHLNACGFILILNVLGILTVFATLGQGIRDLAIVAFPIVFIFSSMALSRPIFGLSVGLSLVAIGWLVLGETSGLFLPQPYDPPNWVDFLMVTVVLLVSAFAVDLLATNMRKSLARSREEITQRKLVEQALRESEERFNLSMDATNDGLWDWNIETDRGYFSPGYYRMLGYAIGDFPAKGSVWKHMIHPDDRERALRANMDCVEGLREQFEVEYRMQAKNGAWRWILARGKCVARDEQGRALRLVGTHMDITDRKQAEEQLRYQGTHDALTGIYNRTFFEAELARLEHSREFPVSIIVADVDELKIANDTRGHSAGDERLRRAAEALSAVFRESDVLARVGGDEYAVLLPATDAATADQMLACVREGLAEQNAGHPELPLQLSLGAATAENSNLTGTFTLADQRMYADKSVHQSSTRHSTAA